MTIEHPAVVAARGEVTRNAAALGVAVRRGFPTEPARIAVDAASRRLRAVRALVALSPAERREVLRAVNGGGDAA